MFRILSTVCSSLIIIFCLHSFGSCVVPRFCSANLNTSDCGQPRELVFYYYKPGSRCEVQLYRGCPTLNKFEDEFTCSHYCIGRIYVRGAEFLDKDSESKHKKTQITKKSTTHSVENGTPTTNISFYTDCYAKVNSIKCMNLFLEVFTFDNSLKKCIQIKWYGCPSPNLFKTELDCIKVCQSNKEYQEWLDKVDGLNNETKVILDEILDTVIDFQNITDDYDIDSTTQKSTPAEATSINGNETSSRSGSIATTTTEIATSSPEVQTNEPNTSNTAKSSSSNSHDVDENSSQPTTASTKLSTDSEISTQASTSNTQEAVTNATDTTNHHKHDIALYEVSR